MTLHTRLHRLERATALSAPGATCGACGNPLPVSVMPATTELHISPPRVIGDPPDPEDDPSKDCCGACGRRLVLRIKPPRLLQPWEARP